MKHILMKYRLLAFDINNEIRKSILLQTSTLENPKSSHEAYSGFCINILSVFFCEICEE